MPKREGPPPPPLAEVQKLLAEADWDEILDYLRDTCLNWGIKREDRIDDLVQSTVDAVWSGASTGEGRVWNPNAQPRLEVYMIGVMRSLRSHGDKYGFDARNVLYDPTGEEMHAATANHPEQLLRAGARAELGRARREAMCARMDAVARDYYEQIEAGTFDAEEFAERHGLSEKEVAAARARMKYHIQSVLDAEDEPPPSSGSRLGAPPARATRTESSDESGEGGPYES